MFYVAYSSFGGPGGGDVEGVRAMISSQQLYARGQRVPIQLTRFLVVFRDVEEPVFILATCSGSDEDASRFLDTGRGLFSLGIGVSFVAQGSLRGMFQYKKRA